MQSSQVIRIIVIVCRTMQVPTALIILGLTISLIPPFKHLTNDCTDNIAGITCGRFSETLGGLHFSISTCVIALIDILFGLASISGYGTIPGWLVITLDSIAAGLYLGSGSNVAARLNGELCEAGPPDPAFACGRLFAVMGLFFVGAVTAYALVACFWVSRARERPVRGFEGDDRGHALQNPFEDPPAGDESLVRDEREVNKRRSWSQLS